MSEKNRDWLIAIGYVILIYSTLEVARLPLAFLRSHGWLKISLGILFSLTAAAVVFIVARRHSTSLWRYLALGGIGGIYFIVARTLHTPEEQIHFIQYGLVGIFFLRALRHSVKNPWKLWPCALLLASLAGWLDELLQGLSPHRHYDPNDIKLNAISAGLGLIIAALARARHNNRPR